MKQAIYDLWPFTSFPLTHKSDATALLMYEGCVYSLPTLLRIPTLFAIFYDFFGSCCPLFAKKILLLLPGAMPTPLLLWPTKFLFAKNGQIWPPT